MSIASMTASSRLATIAGPAHVISDSPNLTAYEISGRKPVAVVSPGTIEEVAEIVKFAAAEKLAIVPTGARTKLQMGLPPKQYDVALDMRRLDRVTAYDPADLTLAVEPGISLARLARTLAEHKQWLPLGAPFEDHSTIGGTIASGVDGTFRQSYGTPRDYVLGIEFVTGEGACAKSGGRVVKNVTGYDLHKLMIGALGTLGIITKINFRTFPALVSPRAFAASFKTAEQALELRHRVSRSPLLPIGLEIFSPGSCERLCARVPADTTKHAVSSNLFSSSAWTLIAGFSGTEKVLKRCEDEFFEMAGNCGGSTLAAIRDAEFSVTSSFAREFVPLALGASPAATVVKISVLPTRMKDAIANAVNAAVTNQLPWAAMARGVGVIYFALLPEDRSEETRFRVIQATDQILHECAELGGNATIPWSPSEWKGVLKVWGPQHADFDQMRKLKNLFDPLNILSPGRFAGGI
jgi:glycolate oxidase FAD binding subunit